MRTNPSLRSLINVGILGLGTVGVAVAEVLKKNSAAIEEKTGFKIVVKKGADKRRIKVPSPLTHDPYDIINDPDISIIVETIGGSEIAKTLVLAALRAGKHVVTSNKELIALYMDDLFKVASANGVSLLFEGAVGGGIPILNTIRDNLSANELTEVFGIVNGTTNYILSKMTAEKREFGAVLKEAQKLGFAEANPKADIEGFDASYKAAILAAVAFGARVKWADVYREGIENIAAEDIAYAADIGYVIKLLAIAKKTSAGLDVRVHPALVAKNHPLASVSENFNAIYVKGFPIGELMFYGPGAGGNPTASAVISDVITIARSSYQPLNLTTLPPVKLIKIDEISSRYYLRLQVADQPGVLAGIAKAFADKKVSIDAVIQKETTGGLATLVILLHNIQEKNLQAAVQQIKQLPEVSRVGNLIRIL